MIEVLYEPKHVLGVRIKINCDRIFNKGSLTHKTSLEDTAILSN